MSEGTNTWGELNWAHKWSFDNNLHLDNKVLLVLAEKLTSLRPQPSMESVKEVVVCAAIKLKNGKIYLGHRHGGCIYAAKDEEGEVDWKGHIQGFMTTKNRFVTREEGRKLQDAAGIESVVGYRGDTLVSEDLY